MLHEEVDEEEWIDCTPKGHFLHSVAAQGITWKHALGEWIDNALDAGATTVTIKIRKGKKGYITVSDNGAGCADLSAFATFGDHQSHGRRNILGTFGIGSKDACLWVGGESSVLEVVSAHNGMRRELTVDWQALAKNKWRVHPPEVEPFVDPLGHGGTMLRVSPVVRRVPSGAELSKLISTLGYLYSPALKRGASVSIAINDQKPRLLKRWEFPELDPVVKKDITVNGKGARVHVGVVPDGAINQRRGVTYLHSYRVIKEATSKGCGEHSHARIAGFVALDASWRLTKNKDDIQGAEDLYDAVEQVCEDAGIFRKADKASHELHSSALKAQIEDALNTKKRRRQDPDKKAKRDSRTGTKPGTVVPIGSGSRHRRAEKEQDGTTFVGRGKRGKAPRRRITFSWDAMEDASRIGEVSDGAVVLNSKHPWIVRTRKDNNVDAIVCVVSSLISASEVHEVDPKQKQLVLKAVDTMEKADHFDHYMGELLGRVSIDGAPIGKVKP